MRETKRTGRARVRGLLARALRPSSFKIGCLVTFLLLPLHPHFAERWTPVAAEFVRGVDDRAHDLMFKIRGPTERTPGELAAVIVDVDEKSLKALGQWPWPRTVVAELVRRIAGAKPRAIGLDIVFAEPDRTSLGNYLPRLREHLKEEPRLSREDLDNDAVLAAAVEDVENLVLGYIFQLEDDGLRNPENDAPLRMGMYEYHPGRPERSPWTGRPVPYRPILNLAALEESANAAGYFNAAFDEAGIVRLVPLVWEYRPTGEKAPLLYPALALEMLRVGEGLDRAWVVAGEGEIAGIKLGDREIRTDRFGRLYVNYRGPKRTFEYIPAVDVLRGAFDLAKFRDRYVLVGTSAPGLFDLRSTPFQKACPGVEIHANVIDNILEGDFIWTPPGLVELVLVATVLLGLALSALVAYTRPFYGAAAAAVAACIVGVATYEFMFVPRILLHATHLMFSIWAVFAVVTLFNYFFEGRQKRFIKGAFGQYVSPHVVEELVRHPRKLALAGHEAELTVMFSDIRGFTPLSETMSAEEMSNFLNEYLTAMTDIIIAEGGTGKASGTVDKFLGDAIMAFWGAPLPDPSHAENAVRCALRMLARLETLNGEWVERGLRPIRIGLGLSTGTMRVGNMGSRTRFDYTVIGDNVNLASRLEDLNKAYGTSLLVAEPTRTALPPSFVCRDVDFVRVKGKRKPARIYEVLGEDALPPGAAEELARHAEALDHYRARHFTKARAAFEALATEKPHGLYRVYVERARELEASPPPDDWDGVYTFTTK